MVPRSIPTTRPSAIFLRLNSQGLGYVADQVAEIAPPIEQCHHRCLRGLSEAKARFTALLAAVDHDLRSEWKIWDEGDGPAREGAQDRMVALLDRRRYLSNLVRDVTETLGA